MAAANENTLWVVSELYYPEMTSTGYYLTKIAEGLALGRRVKAICGQPNYSARGTTAPIRETLNGVEIFRVWGARLDKNFIPFRLVNMLTLGLSVLWAAIRRFRRGDQVLVVTTPPLMPFIAGIVSLIKGASYTLLIHDNYPELAIAAKKMRSGSFLDRWIGRANRSLYKHAAKIIVVGRDMADLLAGKTFGLDVPITVIPNWAELESVAPGDRSANWLLNELGLVDKFVLLYAGNFGYPNDIESIAEAAEILRSENEIHFLFIGEGVKRRWLENRVKSRKLGNITLLPPMPRSEQFNFLNACDVGIVSLVEGMLGVSMPSRTYNLLAAGKPLVAVCEEGSEIDHVVKENRIGWVVPPNHPRELAELILEIQDQRRELIEMGRRSREAAIIQYSAEVAIGKYTEEIGC